MRWTTRILGTAGALFYLAFAIGEGIPSLADGWSNVPGFYVIGIFLASAGIFIGYRFERVGGVLAILSGLLLGFGVVLYGLQMNSFNRADLVAAFLYALPFVIPGSLYLVCDRQAPLRKNRQSGQPVESVSQG
jgi:uncharacterized membrane protein YadS